jgi:hypothetical protein
MSPETQAELLKSLIAAAPGVLGLVLAVISYRRTRDLETFKAELAEQKAENDALRDYKYEARKRLYEEIEPLFFQLVEASEDALHRIYSLARTARCGDLRGADGWLSREGYYAISTMYKLVLPAAIVRVIRERLTSVDLAVDRDINAQYALAKGLYLSFTDDFVFAGMEPALPYDPNRKDWMEKRPTDPAKYSRQGIPLGHLDNAADALIRREGPGQWVSFGEFYARYRSKSPEVYERFDPVATVFLHFHPRTRPVLWRILVTQAHIYQALLRSREMQTLSAAETSPLVRPIEGDERKLFDWRGDGEDAAGPEALAEPFEVAHEYLRKRMGELFIAPGWKPGIDS